LQWDVRFDLRVNLADETLLSTIHEAAAIAKFAQQIPLKPEVRRKMNRLNIIRAVRGTTGIEGSDLTEGEVERVLDAAPGERVLPSSRERQELETRNAAQVMEFVAKTLDADPDRPITEGLICEMHRLTTEGIPCPHNVPGEYRRHGVSVLEYSPPRDGDEVRRLMTCFVDWLNTPPATKWHAVIRAAAAHFYLISIHPFGDGNGRTARAVESYLLYQGKVNQLGFYSLANFYYRERTEYIATLDFTRFQSNGDLTPFVLFSARGLLGEMELIMSEVLEENKKVAFHEYVQERLFGNASLQSKTRGRLLTLMEFLYLSGHLHPASLRSGRGPLAGLYGGPGGARALARDEAALLQEELVVRRGDMIEPNFAAMDQFTRPLFEASRNQGGAHGRDTQ
jgi:Fic family protein